MSYRCRRAVSDVTGKLLKSCEDPESCRYKSSTKRCVKRADPYEDTPSSRMYVGACERARDPMGHLLGYCTDNVNCRLSRGQCVPRGRGGRGGTTVTVHFKTIDGKELQIHDAYKRLVNTFHYHFAGENNVSGLSYPYMPYPSALVGSAPGALAPAYNKQYVFRGPASLRDSARGHLLNAFDTAKNAGQIEAYHVY